MMQNLDTKKEVLFGKEALDRIIKGINTSCNAIKLTYGPCGRNAFIDQLYEPEITNDGVTIAHSIRSQDKFENMGNWLVDNTCSKTFDDAGDNTTVTAILTQALLQEALKRPENSMQVMKEMLAMGKKVEKWIEEEKLPIKDSDIPFIAKTAGESEEIGNLVAEVIAKVGKKVPVYIEDNKFPETTYEVQQGLETKVGYAHNIWVNNPTESTIEFDNLQILALDRRVSSIAELGEFLKMLDKEGIANVCMLVSDMDNSALGTLVRTKAAGGPSLIVIKVRGAELEDMAAVSGATLISEASGIKFADIKKEHLGMAKKFISSDKKTLIIAGDSDVRQKALTLLRSQAKNTKNIYEGQHLNKRADAIEGGIATIRVGAYTDTARGYLKKKILNAVNSTKTAIDEGVVEGGAMCLYRVSNKIKGKSIGEDIFRVALKAPLKAIIENAGEEYSEIVKRMPNQKGYNALTGKFVDMFKEGIIDSVKGVKCAVDNATSTIATFITSGVSIADLPTKENK